MDVKSEKILTVIVVAVVATCLIVSAICIKMSGDGAMNDETLYLSLLTLSTVMTSVVIIYGALVMRDRMIAEQYEEYVERKEKENGKER